MPIDLSQDSTVGQAIASMFPTSNPLSGTINRGLQAGAAIPQAFQNDGMGAGIAASLQALLSSLEEPRQVLSRALGTTPDAIDNAGGSVAKALGAPEGLGRFAASAVTDPLNFVGVGAPKAALQGLGKLGVSEANPFMGLLKGGVRNDALISEAGGKAADALVKGIQDGLVPVNEGLGKLFPSLPAWGEVAKKGSQAAKASQWLQERHGLDLSGAQSMFASLGADELHKLLPTEMGAQFTKDDLERLLLSGDKKTADFSEAQQSYLKGLKDELGLKNDSQFHKFYDEFTNWWKRQAVGSLSFLGTNLKGGMLFNGLEGVAPQDILKDMWANKKDIFQGNKFDIKDAADLRTKTGIPIPADLDMGAHAAAASGAGTGTLAPRGIDMALGAGLGAYGDQDNPLQGALVGAGAGAAMAPLAGKVREISQGIETVLRQRGWVKGMGDSLVNNMAEADRAIQAHLGKTKGAGLLGPDGAFNADDVVRTFETPGPVDEKTRENLARELDDLLYKSSQAGVNKSNAANFDYGDLSNIERALKTVFPFATWAMKALPYTAQQAGRHPALANVPLEWNEAAHEDRKAKGLTSRVEGAMENPIGSTILSHLLGHGVKDYQNPFAQFVPLADASRSLSNLEYSSGPVDVGLSLLSALGLSPNPVLDTAARTAGLEGSDAPAKGFPLRLGSVVDGLTGVDMNKAGTDLESAIRTKITGQRPTNMDTLSVAKRMDELALRNTGKTVGSGDPAVAQYIREKAAQSGPLWDAARKEVDAEQAVTSTTGFVDAGLKPQTLVTNEESAIRGASTETLIPQTASKTLQALAKAQPQGDAPLHLVQAVLDANDAVLGATGKETPPEIADRLRNPTNENLQWVASQIFDWQAKHNDLLRGYTGSGSMEKRDIQAQQAAAFTAGQVPSPLNLKPMENPFKAISQRTTQERTALQSQPAIQKYLTWKTLNPNGTIDDFLAAR